jgi:CxxC motif-containing protein (DUF1111 family)
MKKTLLTFIPLLVLSVIACSKLTKAPAADAVMNAPLEGLTNDQRKLFLEGADEFEELYTAEKGLGPIFVATSCGGCHAGDNKGHPFTTLTRFGQKDTNGNTFLDKGGPQLQHRAIPGHSPEVIPDGASSAKFLAPIVSGVGFIDLVPDQDILAMADPLDLNGDGISGVCQWKSIPSWISPRTNAPTQNGKYLCRFGRKAGAYSLVQQVAGAYNNDMGLTTSFLPANPVNYLEPAEPTTGDIEIPDKNFSANVFYLRALQAPTQRNPTETKVANGKQLFIQAGCENCHKQTLKTGFSAIAPLSYKDFHPYTDLLLHDMGAELNDNYTEGSALASEWRTTPLWGVGLSSASQGGKLYLMHDGRAATFDAAIQLHGGEAAKSRTNFNALSDADKADLIKFLESL